MGSNVFIHPTASVHPAAVIGEGTKIGAFAIVEQEVTIGRNCEIQEHAIVRSFTRMGDEVKVYPFALLGGDPQHTKYQGEPTTLEIGSRTVLREFMTAHRGTVFGHGKTIIGEDSYIMAYAHVAHDCIVGKGVIIANTVQLAGHVEVGDYTVIGGLSAMPQFTRIGPYCYIGGGTITRKDVPPFIVGKGSDFKVQGINAIGLGRHGFSEATITRLRRLFKIFYKQNLTVGQAIEKASVELGDRDEIKMFLDFVRESKVGIER